MGCGYELVDTCHLLNKTNHLHPFHKKLLLESFLTQSTPDTTHTAN